ncbi:uncharacterized protein LOC143277672 [Babylonia areolata]|uniref:uncharacterized protein LOC143277672 n=1 Tax=Babylonia areolata TaxID=304850 RepID=UPI003FD5BB17
MSAVLGKGEMRQGDTEGPSGAEDAVVEKLLESCIMGALSSMELERAVSEPQAARVSPREAPSPQRASEVSDDQSPVNVNVNVEVDSNFDSARFMQEVKQQISQAMDEVMVCQMQALEFQRQCLQSDQRVLRELQEVSQPRPMISAHPPSQGASSTSPHVSNRSPSPGPSQGRKGKIMVSASHASLVDY